MTAFTIAAAVWLLAAATPAAAQDPADPRFSVGVAAGVALPWHGDFGFTATAWQVDARFRVSRYFATGAFYEEWRHTDEQVFGTAGAPITARTEHTTRTVGWNALGKAPLGRLALTGGGGVSVLLYERDYALSGNATMANRFNNASLCVHAQAGADVAITSHIAAMGQFRMVVPIEDVGGGHSSITGGVRVMF